MLFEHDRHTPEPVVVGGVREHTHGVCVQCTNAQQRRQSRPQAGIGESERQRQQTSAGHALDEVNERLLRTA